MPLFSLPLFLLENVCSPPVSWVPDKLSELVLTKHPGFYFEQPRQRSQQKARFTLNDSLNVDRFSPCFVLVCLCVRVCAGASVCECGHVCMCTQTGRSTTSDVIPQAGPLSLPFLFLPLLLFLKAYFLNDLEFVKKVRLAVEREEESYIKDRRSTTKLIVL